jgi:hypothetical protein
LIELAEYIQQRSQLVIVSAEPWDRLFRVLLNVAGWGPKTAALFVKCVVNVHRSDVTELHFLRDATIAQTLAAKDRIYLPVDAVIKRIFKEIAMAGVGNTFDSINGVLQKANYSAEDMLVWDDLWFWGFFSQNSSSVERSLGWNAARFWGQISTPKADVREIRRQCETFLRLLNQGGASVKQKLSTIRPPESGH